VVVFLAVAVVGVVFGVVVVVVVVNNDFFGHALSRLRK
jgi:hypothetical protein